jgi:hypothetical protein
MDKEGWCMGVFSVLYRIKGGNRNNIVDNDSAHTHTHTHTHAHTRTHTHTALTYAKKNYKSALPIR